MKFSPKSCSSTIANGQKRHLKYLPRPVDVKRQQTAEGSRKFGTKHWSSRPGLPSF